MCLPEPFTSLTLGECLQAWLSIQCTAPSEILCGRYQTLKMCEHVQTHTSNQHSVVQPVAGQTTSICISAYASYLAGQLLGTGLVNGNL